MAKGFELGDIAPWAISIMVMGILVAVLFIVLGSIEQDNLITTTSVNVTQSEDWTTEQLRVSQFSEVYFEMQVNSTGGFVGEGTGIHNNTLIGAAGVDHFVDPGDYYAGANGSIAWFDDDAQGTSDTEVNVTYQWIGQGTLHAGTQNVTRAAVNLSKQLPTVGTLVGVSALIFIVMLLYFGMGRKKGGVI